MRASQMVEFIDNERETREAAEARRVKDLKDKDFIFWKVKFREWDELAKIKNAERNEWEELKRVKREAFDEEWSAKEKQAMDAVRKYVLHLIEAKEYSKKAEPQKRADQDAAMQVSCPAGCTTPRRGT